MSERPKPKTQKESKMAYFNNSIKTIKELKSAYHKLALKNHPDVGGDIEVMKAINVEYDTIQ